MGKTMAVEFVCNHCDSVEKVVVIGDMTLTIDRPTDWSSIRRGVWGKEELVCPSHEISVSRTNGVESIAPPREK